MMGGSTEFYTKIRDNFVDKFVYKIRYKFVDKIEDRF